MLEAAAIHKTFQTVQVQISPNQFVKYNGDPKTRHSNTRYIDRVPSFYLPTANMATFYHSETACTHFSDSPFQSDKID